MKACFFVLGISALVGCEAADAARQPLTREQLLDPESCKSCHERTFVEWSASMHAYAVEDPVFRAMNAQAQEAGQGDFCVSCHAPMAVREAAFANGDFNDFEQVPDQLEGVTCFFCHSVVAIERDHNNGLVLAEEDDDPDNDRIMRGGIADPVQPYAHLAAASKHFDTRRSESSQLCGSCHDIVVPGTGFHLERTYEEYQSSVFAQAGPGQQSCIDCHMPTKGEEVVATYDYMGEVAPGRQRHSHLFPGVDVPLTPFPGREAMVSAVESFMLPQGIGVFQVEADTGGDHFAFTVSMDTEAGHMQPSGAAQDRRMWLEWTAYDSLDRSIGGSGTIEDGELEVGRGDELWLIRDVLFADDGEETHLFWEAETRDDSQLLPVRTPANSLDHSRLKTFAIETLDPHEPPARIEFLLRLRPIGFDVLQELVEAGDLDAAILDEMPTFTVYQATATWPDPGNADLISVEKVELFDGRDYRCKLFPADRDCD